MMAARRPRPEERPIPGGYPSFRTIATTQIPTRKHIPKAARAAVAEAMAKTLNAVNTHGDQLAWLEWEMLPKAILSARNTRGGVKHQNQAAADIRSRCRKWLLDDKLALWRDACTNRRQGRANAKKNHKESDEDAWERTDASVME